MIADLTEDRFLKDVANHKMQVIRDDVVHRHIRFKEPGTMMQHFDLITWPGYLCYTGDMGTYVFQRLEDMFEFFRTDREYKKRNGAKLAINPGYWGEKLQAIERNGGYREYSPGKFRAQIEEIIKNRGLTGKLGHGLRDELESDVLAYADHGVEIAMQHAMDFKWDGKEVFRDLWEYNFDEYTHRYIWCCYALAWGIEQYDAAKDAGVEA